MSSEFEGFPITLIEAQQAGLPTVAYDNCNGPNLLISDGVNGILADGSSEKRAVKSLSCALEILIEDEKARLSFVKKSKQSSQKYLIDAVLPEWEKLLLSVAGKMPPSE